MQSKDAFKKAEDRYFHLKDQLAAGRITSEQFNSALKDLMVEQGARYWVLGANSGKWYVHDGQAWIQAEPPGERGAERAKTASALTAVLPSIAESLRTSGPTGRPATSQPATSAKFDVILERVGDQKISVVKAIRDITGLSLAPTKALVESAPTAIKTNLSRPDAEQIKGQLEGLHATVQILPAGTYKFSRTLPPMQPTRPRSCE